MSARSDSQGWVLEAVDLYELPLQRYARRLVGDIDLATDVVQHAFLKLCEQSQANLQGRVAPWLFRVCRNKAIDHLRHADRQRLIGDSTEQIQSHSEAVRSTDDPASVAEAKDLVVQVRSLVKTLPASQRDVLDLWCEGFTHNEIAGITDRSAGHVRVLVHRGLTALRRHPLLKPLLPAQHVSEGKS